MMKFLFTILVQLTKEIHLLTTDIPSEVLSLLQDNKIIFGAVASTVNERYKRLVNFSVPISIQPYSFLVSKPHEVSRIYLFTAPFTHGVSNRKNPPSFMCRLVNISDVALSRSDDNNFTSDSLPRKSFESVL